jgi:nucleotide-binding universal stress UspA family protein
MLPLPESEDGKGAVCKRNILVVVSGADLDRELVTLACNTAKIKKANVYVIYGIEVPRKLQIDAEMPEQTQAAGMALEAAAGVAEQMHVRVQPEIVQSRHLGQSLVDESYAHDCSLLILGLPYHVGMGGHFDLGETADYVLKNSPCRVWVIRGAHEQEPNGRAETSDRVEAVSAGR